MSTLKKRNLHWGSIMDFLITKLELFLISTNLGYKVKTKTKTFPPFICPFFFPNPLLNAFLAEILCEPFFYHTKQSNLTKSTIKVVVLKNVLFSISTSRCRF